jgi:hypothetical protein
MLAAGVYRTCGTKVPGVRDAAAAAHRNARQTAPGKIFPRAAYVLAPGRRRWADACGLSCQPRHFLRCKTHSRSRTRFTFHSVWSCLPKRYPAAHAGTERLRITSRARAYMTSQGTEIALAQQVLTKRPTDSKAYRT